MTTTRWLSKSTTTTATTTSDPETKPNAVGSNSDANSKTEISEKESAKTTVSSSSFSGSSSEEAATTTTASSSLSSSSSSFISPRTRSTAQSLLDSSTHAAQAATHRVREGVTTVVQNTNVSDVLTVTAIVVVFGILAIYPFAEREMKKSTRTVDDIAITDDPIDDFPRLAREEWLEMPPSSSQYPNALEGVLQDVVRSQALQQAAKQFVVQIIESEPVRLALNRLLKQLWTDLVTDPETVAQVIHLLHIAIQDEAVKKAAQNLVIDLVNEPAVKQSLIEMVQKLGLSEQVQQATQTLLVHSAHKSLNDAEILEHSMEFATDVLGDDVVQQTAGEALRNTVGHAVRPAATIMVTATGISLIFFGIVAIAYARSSDSEIRLLETAAKSLHDNAVSGLGRFFSWPFRKVYQLGEILGNVLFYQPWLAFQCAVQTIFLDLPRRAGRAVWLGLSHSMTSLREGFIRSIQMLWTGLISNPIRWGRQLILAWLQRTTDAATQWLDWQWFHTRLYTSRVVTKSTQNVWDFLACIEESILAWWNELVEQVSLATAAAAARWADKSSS